MQILALTLLESCPKAGKFRLPLLRNRLRRRSPSSSSIEWIKLWYRRRRRAEWKVNIKFKDYVNFPHFWVLEFCFCEEVFRKISRIFNKSNLYLTPNSSTDQLLHATFDYITFEQNTKQQESKNLNLLLWFPLFAGFETRIDDKTNTKIPSVRRRKKFRNHFLSHTTIEHKVAHFSMR